VKFGSSPAEQAQAHFIVSAMRDGDLDRMNKVPLFEDKEGKPVYRILLCGLRWRSDGKGSGCYRALDGVIGTAKIGSARLTTYREWAIGRDANGKWSVCLHDDQEGSPHIIASDLRTLGLAKSIAGEHARRMPWIEGAPW